MMRPGSQRARVLLAVARGSDAESNLARRAQLAVAATAKIVSALLNRGLLRFSDGVYHLSDEGRVEAEALGWTPTLRERKGAMRRGLLSLGAP
jgi:hypothetical protein